MMVLFDYIGKMALVSGVLYAYYHWVLRDNRFHQWNRFYLLAAVFLSLTLPLFHISLARQTATDNRLLSAVYALLDQKGSGTAPVMLNPPTGINWQVVLISSYLCISALLMLLFCTRLLHLGKLKHRSPHIQLDDFTLVRTAGQGSPFSFFHWIFWDDNLELDSPEGRRILRHELTHVHQKHSIDKVVMQLILVLFFPIIFFYLIRRELQIIHEYLADKEATRNEDLEAYARMLVSEVFQAGPYAFANSFFQHPVRRRIAMMTRFTNPRFAYLRKLMFLPLSLVLFCLLAFRVEEKYPGLTIQIQKDIRLTGIDLSATTRAPQDPPVFKAVPVDPKPRFVPPHISTVPVTTPPEVQLLGIKPSASNWMGKEQVGIPYQVVGYGNTDEIQDPSIAENPNPLPSVTVTGFTRARKAINESGMYDSIQYVLDNKTLEHFPHNLAPERIASITVIKGGNQEAIRAYGYKAAGGVIIIKTKPEGASFTGTVVQFDSSADADNKIFTKVEIESSFPGGDHAWSEYVKTTLVKHMDELQQAGVSGSCDMQFVVDKEGHISDVQALTMKGSTLAKICIDALAGGPKWNPAIQNGRKVTSFRHQKITFSLASE